MLQRIKSKKGFTLAELLIVVAIIAVLTAIAVPLFVTSLQKANEATFNANKDVVRTAGISTILNTPDYSAEDENYPGYTLATLKGTDIFECTGTFEKGEFKTVTVTFRDAGASAKEETKFDDVKGDIKGGNYSITVWIKVADIGANTTVQKPKG